MVVLVSGAALTAVLLPAVPAHASFHEMVISEIFVGAGTHSDVEFIELEMIDNGQNLVNGTEVQVFSADGTSAFTIPLEQDVFQGIQERNILIGTPATATELFNVDPDQEDEFDIPTAGGKACFRKDGFGVIDCAAWGNYTGTGPVGGPFNPGEGLIPGSSMERLGTGNQGSTPTDTDDSAEDFIFSSLPNPRNNGSGDGIAPNGAIGYQSPTYTVTEDQGTATINLVRDGSNTGAAKAEATVEGGTADFETDFDMEPFTAEVAAGQTSNSFTVDINDDDDAEPDETVLLHLRGPHTDNVLGRPDAVLVIEDDEVDAAPPESAVSRPENGKSYQRDKLPKVRGIATDQGTGLDFVKVGIRKNLTNGNCKWLTTSGFVAGPCSQKKFLFSQGKTEWFFNLPNLLGKSVGTSTKNYTVYSKGVDVAGNQETAFDLGRNRNNFEVT